MSLHIRPAVAADAPALAELVRGLNAFHHDPLEHCTAETIVRDGFGKRPAFAVLLAEVDGVPVGYALFHDAYEPVYAARGIYMSDLYVAETARRSGAGRALVAAVAAEARRRGAVFVGWVSRRWNTAAQEFYRTLGAIEEPTMSHAVAFDAFTKLADEGDRRQSSRSSRERRR
jgi:GNAT superfamily N-acetyltransferase